MKGRQLAFNPQKFISDGECPYCSGATYSEDGYDVEFINLDCSEIVMRFGCRGCGCHFELFYQFKSLKTDRGDQYSC